MFLQHVYVSSCASQAISGGQRNCHGGVKSRTSSGKTCFVRQGPAGLGASLVFAEVCGSLRKVLRTYWYPREIDGERSSGGLRWLEDYGFLYQNIASATSATVMIHRMMSLLRFFSSAIDGQEHTSKPAASAVLIKCRPNDLFRGRRARSRFTLVPRQLQDLPQMN